ncbi:MAG TPA: 30S ribosomal protein S8 [Patescibacteria group bacterium]|nr:30S ribosomal protein S8 [Patescibacteria group bacterium]
MVNYTVGDFLIRVKNAARADRTDLTVNSTKLVKAIAECLKTEGFLSEVSVNEGKLTAKIAISHKKPVLMDLTLISKPGLRVYRNIDELKLRKKGSSILILTTPKGIISNKKAIKENVGGEVIAEIW